MSANPAVLKSILYVSPVAVVKGIKGTSSFCVTWQTVAFVLTKSIVGKAFTVTETGLFTEQVPNVAWIL